MGELTWWRLPVTGPKFDPLKAVISALHTMLELVMNLCARFQHKKSFHKTKGGAIYDVQLISFMSMIGTLGQLSFFVYQQRLLSRIECVFCLTE